MKNKYKLYKKSLQGVISKIESYVFDDHSSSFKHAALGTISALTSAASFPMYMAELNGTMPRDPESPMFIPAVGGAIMAFGFFAVAIKRRVDEDKELREEYAREYAREQLEQEQARTDAERLRANRNECIINFLTNPYAEEDEIEKPRTR